MIWVVEMAKRNVLSKMENMAGKEIVEAKRVKRESSREEEEKGVGGERGPGVGGREGRDGEVHG